LGHLLLPGLCKGGANHPIQLASLPRMIFDMDYIMPAVLMETKQLSKERSGYK